MREVLLSPRKVPLLLKVATSTIFQAFLSTDCRSTFMHDGWELSVLAGDQRIFPW